MIWADWETAMEWLDARGYKGHNKPIRWDGYSYSTLENEHIILLCQRGDFIMGVVTTNLKR